jgi:membrane protease YdiL (CAAX protease family)
MNVPGEFSFYSGFSCSWKVFCQLERSVKMDTQLNTKRILIFLAFAFGIPWTAALALHLTVGKGDPVKAQALANGIAVSIPWLANVATRLITREGRGRLWLRPNFRRGWRFYLSAWLLPLLAVIVGGATFYLLFPRSFDPNVSGVWSLIGSSPSAAASNPWTVLLSTTLSIMIFTVPITTVMSLGEEFGWRAYLLPKLVERLAHAERASASADDPAHAGDLNAVAARKAALLVGVIHGVWHWPLIIMTAEFTPGFTFLTPLIYIVFTCSMSILVSWATLRSGSVWPAALGHGTVNPTSSLPGCLLKGPAIPLLGPEITGLIGGIGYTILALVLFFGRRAFAGGKEAGSEKEWAAAGAL